MQIDIWYEGTNYCDKGWFLKINKEVISRNAWKKEKLIKVINTIIEAIEED